jgi:integrase
VDLPSSHSDSDADLIQQLPEALRSHLAVEDDKGWPDEAAVTRARATADEQVQAVAIHADGAVPDNTLRAYRADWATWTAWCTLRAHPPLPAAALDFAAFLVASALLRPEPTASSDKSWRYSLSVMERRLVAITKVHEAHGLPSAARDPLVKDTMKVIRAFRAGQQRRDHRAAGLDVIKDMLAGRPGPGWPGTIAGRPATPGADTVTRRRDKALLLLGYAGRLSRSELPGLTVDDVLLDQDDAGAPILLLVPGGALDDAVALPKSPSALVCPVCAYVAWAALLDVHASAGIDGLRDYVSSIDDVTELRLDIYHRCDQPDAGASTPPSGLALFPRVHRNGDIGTKAMTGQAVYLLIKRYAERAGEDPAAFSTLSLRAGRDHDQDQVVRSQRLGREVPVSRRSSKAARGTKTP